MQRPSKTLRCLALIAVTLCASPVQAEQAEPVAWKTGDAFDAQLRLEAGVTWREMPLEQGLDNLGRYNGVAIWLDRHVNPDQKIDFESSGLPLEQTLEKLAHKLNLESVRVGPVIYIGPSVKHLGTLAAIKRQEAETLPATTQRRMADLSPTQWDTLSEPRNLVEKISTRCGLRTFYLENVPHDLWRERDLPAMHGAELLTIILAGFHLSFEFSPDGTAIRPIEIPPRIVLIHEYAYQGDMAKAMDKIREFFPDSKLDVRNGKLRVEGSQEEHREIARLLSGKTMRRTVTQPGTKVYSLDVQGQPVGGIVVALGKKLERNVVFDPALTQEDLTQSVSFTVKDKTLPELLQAALEPAGLTFELTSEVIKVRKLDQ